MTEEIKELANPLLFVAAGPPPG